MFTDNMKWLMLVVLFHLLLICSKCNKVINITSQDHLLQSYLCNHYHYTDDTTLLLLDTLYNISGNGSMCTINTNYSLTIQGNNSMATIQCISSTYVNTTHPTIGFAFSKSSSLTLQRVTFIGCGANLTTFDKEQLNIINSTSSPFYFTQYHAAVFVFTEINHIVMREVSISQYYGFAIVAVNLPNGILDSVIVNYSQGIPRAVQKSGYIVGCGVLLLYKNSTRMSSIVNQYKVLITSSSFRYNYEFKIYHKFTCATIFYNSLKLKHQRNPIINAAALTILYTQNDIKAQVNISRCTFEGNIGSIAGAMFVLHLNTIKNSETVIYNESVFHSNGNTQKCHGSSIVLIMYFDVVIPLNSNSTMYHLMEIINVTFESSERSLFFDKQQGTVYIAMINVKTLPILIKFFNATFTNSAAITSGSCILVASYPSTRNHIQIVMESVKARNNDVSGDSPGKSPTKFSQGSLFHLLNINFTKINGTVENPSDFSYNFGTVIEAIQSGITLEGHIVFHNNTGINGAAIMLIGDSLIYLTQELRANFTHNKALFSGGAIYAVENIFTQTFCSFQVSYNHSRDNITIFFKSNEATIAGNSVYTPNLYNCYIGEEWVNYSKAIEIYDNIFSNGINDISTTPINLTICDLKDHTYNLIHEVYPGETFNISVAAVDAAGNNSYSIVTVTAINKTHTKFTHINWWLSERENTQVIRETDDCTLINVTLHTNDSNILDKPDGALLFTVAELRDSTLLNIKLKSCPPCFQLDNKTGSCMCSHVLSSKLLGIDSYTPDCNINTRTFNRPTTTSWIGSVNHNKTSVFLLSLQCPHGYCNDDFTLSVFHYRNDGTFEIMSKDLSTKSSLCLNNREGILCSKCSIVNGVNYSVVFGSTECRQCSNWWLGTLVLYAVAGPLLVYLLYAFRLTLTTGTFNGIIFYAQAANVGILDMLSVYNGKMEVVRKISIVLLSLLNLGLGFPLCFYNGMTELWKTGLSLLFPLYLLTIVVVLIILSRYSLRFSNRIAYSSVQVLVTVVHLSFGKLLGSIINVFTPVKVFTSEQTYHVWYWDGSVEYGSEEHITLMVITSLVVFPLLLPYVLLLIFTKPLRHWRYVNEYTRPILEAIHAPYKNGKQYWFVARLLLLIMMYILYSIEPYAHTIYITIASALFFVIIGQAMFRPYKSNFINLLDCWLLFNLVFIYTTTWYLGHMEVTVYSIITILLFFMTFFIILVYHILFITGQLKKGERKVYDICTRISQYFSCFNHKYQYHGKKKSRRLPLQDANDSFYDSCDNYREPMLSHN